jgi:hypothetical protein
VKATIRFSKLVLLALFYTATARGSDSQPTFLVFENGSSTGTPASGEITVANSAAVEMRTDFSGGQIFYTVDGGPASFSSNLYSNKLQITQSTTINAVAYNVDFSESSTNSLKIEVAPTFTLSVQASGGVLVSPAGGTYRSNTVVTLTAYDTNGWNFSHWSGAIQSTNRTVEITMDSDKTIQAHFLTTINLQLPVGGDFVAHPSEAELNDTVVVSAIPDDMHYFAAWGGVVSGNQNPTRFTVTGPNPLVTAAFAPLGSNQVTLTVLQGPANLFIPAILEPRKNVYEKGETVTIKLNDYVTDQSNYDQYSFLFNGWSGDVQSFDDPLVLTLTNNTQIQENILSAFDHNAIAGRLLENPPAIGNDDSVYVTSALTLYAYTPSLELKWTQSPPETELSIPSIGKSGLIYVGASDGDVVAFDKYGNIIWSFASGEPKNSNPLPEFYDHGHPLAVSSDETVYSMSSLSGMVYAVKNGELVRNLPAFPLIGGDDTLYVPTASGFSALHPDGSVKWTNPNPEPLAIDSNGYLYGLNGNSIYSIRANGVLNWSTSIPSGATSILIGETNTLFLSTDAGVVALSSGGNVLWTNQYSGNVLPTANGGAYVFDQASLPPVDYPPKTTYWIRSISPSGSNFWFFERDQTIKNINSSIPTGTMTGNGDFYYTWVPTSSLFTYRRGDHPALSSWNMVRGNAQNTGRAEPLTRTLDLESFGHGSINASNPNTEVPLYSTVTLTAVPEAGAEFSYWTGDISTTVNPLSFKMDSHKHIIAVFDAGIDIQATLSDGALHISSTNAPVGALLQVSTNLVQWSTTTELETNTIVPISSDPKKFYRIIAE